MRVELALLADYAAVSREGKLSIAGIFDRISVPKLPWVHPSMTLVFRLRVTAEEATERHFTIRGIDPEGKEFMPTLEGDWMLQEVDFLDGASANFMFGLNMLTFEKKGRYHFDLSVDGRYEETVGFDILLPSEE